jgi:hypothetical protein
MPLETSTILFRSAVPIKRRCRFCGGEFEPKREWQNFCKTNCRTAYWSNCLDVENDKFIEALMIWVAGVDYDHKAFVALRKAVCSRIAKRQTPHGPGKKKK